MPKPPRTGPPATTAGRRKRRPKPRINSLGDFNDVPSIEVPAKPRPPILLPAIPRQHPAPNGYEYTGELPAGQYGELCRGPGKRPQFLSDEDRRQAWVDHCDDILADFEYLQVTDRRPWAHDEYGMPE